MLNLFQNFMTSISIITTISIVFIGYIMLFAKPLPDVIITNIHKRYTGVTSTIINLFPEHAKTLDVGLYGNRINVGEKIVNFIDLLYYGYQLSEGKKCRIFHVRRNNEMIWALIFRDILRLPIKIIFTQTKIRYGSYITNYLTSKVDFVIVTHKRCINYLKNKEKVISIIPHGIKKDINKIINYNDIYNLKDKFVVSIFGRVRKEKGTDIFVKALIKILIKYPLLTGCIIGEIDSISFKDDLTNLINKNRLTDRILFTGFINKSKDYEKYKYIYNNTDLCIAVPRYEGFGLTPIEAMANGIPVICSDTGAFYTMIDEDKTGNLIPIGDIDILADKIEYYINNQNKLKEMSKYCIDKVNNDFTIEVEAYRINKVYEKILLQ